MRKTFLLLVAAAGMSFGAPTITVIPSIGPSSVAASGVTYDANALQALRQGLTTFGTAGTPGFYGQLTGDASANQVIDTFGLFNSWLGIANPSTPFENEYGNNLYFGVVINGGLQSFSLSQLVYEDNLATYDPSLIGTTPFSFNGDTYDSRFLAFVDDGNGVLDGADSQVALNADGSTLVNYLFYRGIPTFFLPLKGATDQEALDNTVAALNANAPLAITASYCLADTPGSTDCGAASGRASAVVGGEIPEPSTYALMGLGLAALAYVRRRMA